MLLNSSLNLVVVNEMAGQSASQRIWQCRSFSALDASKGNDSHSRFVNYSDFCTTLICGWCWLESAEQLCKCGGLSMFTLKHREHYINL